MRKAEVWMHGKLAGWLSLDEEAYHEIVWAY